MSNTPNLLFSCLDTVSKNSDIPFDNLPSRMLMYIDYFQQLKKLCTKTFVLILNNNMEVHCKFQNTIIALLPRDQRFINICETFEALGRFKENTIDLSFFDQEAFQHLRQQVSHNIPIPFNKNILIKVTEIASFLNISESNLVAILQSCRVD